MMRQAGVQLTSNRLPNLPSLDLLTGPRDDYLKFCLPLYEASIECDWKAAKTLFDQKPYLVRHSITENGETTLHVGASAKGPKHMEEFVKNLVDLMDKDDLALENKNFNTALYLAAGAGNLKTVRIMVEKNNALLVIPGGEGKMLPLYAAASSGNYEVVKYLYENSNDLSDADGWTDVKRGWLLEKCVENDMFDVALQIVQKYPKLGRHGSMLGILAQKPDAFVVRERKLSNIITRILVNIMIFHCGCSGLTVDAREGQALQLLRFILDDIVKLPKNEIDSILIIRGPAAKNTHSSEALFTAAERGNTIFVVELIRRYPDIMWKVNDNNQTIFHIAVENRHEGIYNILYEIGYMKDSITSLVDENGNNMSHLVAKIAKKKKLEQVPGVIFQMQRELRWFKEVESMINPSCRERKNKDGITPHELFTKEHEDLLAQSVKWVKATANQCMVVAALVATITFAAAITIPGGYNQDNGIPIFYRNIAYTTFILADTVSLLASSLSILMFINILTSWFGEHKFLVTIPKKFTVFFSTLFLSIASMVLSFIMSFFIIYQKEMQWMLIFISAITGYLFLNYVVLQSYLFRNMIWSLKSYRNLFKPKKRVIYYQNPVL